MTMETHMRNRLLAVCSVGLLAVMAAACDLDLNDPNIPTEEAVIGASTTMAQVAVGLQAEYSNQFAGPVYVTGMVTNELGAGSATFQSFFVLDTGSEPATNDFGASTTPWEGQYRVVRVADVVISDAPNVGFGPGTTSGLLALGRFFKARALGNLIQIYERIPLDVGATIRSPEFAERNTVLTTVVELFESAQTQLAQTPASAEFNAQILAPGFNLENSIRAMIARYALIAGDLAKADAAAASVNLNVWSEFRFSTTDANPFWNLAVNGGNSTSMRPKQIFREEAEAGDDRVLYWVTPADIQGHSGLLDNFSRYSSNTHSYPVYVPDEMRLIRAEVAARQNRLNDALGFVNEVRTQCASPHPEPLACLPALTLADVPTQEAMLDEILKQRRYELYLQHVRWSDLRRFGKPVKYQWMPVPITECDRNTNTPPALCQPQPANPAGWD
jgi:starch-binding outer membrane protein, SusD/RagB family